MATSSLLLLLALLAPEQKILKAPEGVDRWEPSGAAVLQDHLWVASDRAGHVARYPLPLGLINRPDLAHQLKPRDGKIKWEGLTTHGGALYLLEAYGRQVWRCDDPEGGCPALRPAEPPIKPLWDRALDATPYLGLEALSVDARGILWTGSRGYVVEGRFEISPQLISASEGWRWIPPRIDGRALGLSGATHDDAGLWTTWSLEINDDDTRVGVGGLLARAAVDPRTGRIGPGVIKARFNAKPEGVAIWRDHVIVVFDEDKSRKGRVGGFRLSASEDYAVMVGIEGG